MKLYKLTDCDGYTRRGQSGETLWVVGETRALPEAARGTKLCEKGVFHAYTDPFLAVLMDLIHGHYLPTGRLWECEGEPVVTAPDKVGCHTLGVVQEIPALRVTAAHRVRFMILVALAMDCPWPGHEDAHAAWLKWAQGWLDGTDRTEKSACTARGAAYSAYAHARFAANAACAATGYVVAIADALLYTTLYAAEANNPPLEILAFRAIAEEPG